MTRLSWTLRARNDLQAIQAYVAQDSPAYAGVVVSRIIAATDRLARFPNSGRPVPEFESEEVREVIWRPYRIVYRVVSANELHILTVHHSARQLPPTL